MTSRNQKAKIDLLAGTFDIPTVAEAPQPENADEFWSVAYQKLWKSYVKQGGEVHALTREVDQLTEQRDALARRCAEQAKHIAGLLELQAEEAAEAERHPLADAIAVMQRAGVR